MEEIREKFSALLGEKLNSQMQLLFESFVMYYGEENRNLIKEIFNRTQYIFYINGIDTNNKCTPIYESILIEKYPDHVQNDINHALKNKITCCISTYDSTKNCDLYTLVINITKNIGDRTLIHEINHTIGNETLLFNDEYIYKKSGLKMFSNNKTNDNEKILDELLNEASAKKIYDIFQAKGGNILDSMITRGVTSIYYLNFYLIDDFFTLIEPYFKDAKISINKNKLIKMCGIENYNLLLDFLSRNYSIHQDIILDNRSNFSVQIEKETLLEKIKQNIENEKDFNYESYFSLLQQNGHKVRKLEVNNG